MLREPHPGYILSGYERETIINWSNNETEAQVYSLNPSIIRKMDKLSAEFPDVYRCTCRVSDGGEWMMPVKLIRFAKPPSAAIIAHARENAAKLFNPSLQECQSLAPTDMPSPADDRLSTPADATAENDVEQE